MSKTELVCNVLHLQIKAPTPCITGRSGEFQVHMDGVPILQAPAKSFERALQAWFATFWIFSVSYPRGLQNSCEFFEKVLLGKGGRVPASVRKWCNRLGLSKQ